MDLKKFFGELKRRNVYKVAVAYAVVAWLLVQVATQVFPFFELRNWAIRLVILILVIGFVVALVFSWAFELTPEGLKRTQDVAVTKSVTKSNGRKLDFVIIAILLLLIGIFAYQRFAGQKVRSAAESPVLEKSIAVLPFDLDRPVNLATDDCRSYISMARPARKS